MRCDRFRRLNGKGPVRRVVEVDIGVAAASVGRVLAEDGAGITNGQPCWAPRARSSLQPYIIRDFERPTGRALRTGIALVAFGAGVALVTLRTGSTGSTVVPFAGSTRRTACTLCAGVTLVARGAGVALISLGPVSPLSPLTAGRTCAPASPLETNFSQTAALLPGDLFLCPPKHCCLAICSCCPPKRATPSRAG